MITFHNDHLIAPEFCKLMYDTIPEELHVPVFFVAHADNYRISGDTNGERVRLNLQGIFHSGWQRTGEFGLWKRLLYVAYHEFGHIATNPLIDPLLDNGYESNDRIHSIFEGRADDWAKAALLRLAEFDKRIAQPKRLGPYFDGRIVKIKKGMPHTRVPGRFLNEYRKYKSGGQLSIGEVSFMLGPYFPGRRQFTDDEVDPFGGSGVYHRFTPTRVIRKLAADLAYPYIDRAGRLLMFFAWGDVPEIFRRVARYKAALRAAGDER